MSIDIRTDVNMERNVFVARLVVIVSLFFCFSVAKAQLPVTLDKDKGYYGLINPQKAEQLHQSFFSNKESSFRKQDKTVSLGDYRTFMELYKLAPYSDYNYYTEYFYCGDNSVTARMLKGSSDMSSNVVIVDDLLRIAYNVVENLDSVNILRSRSVTNLKDENDTISLPVAMTKYAHWYYNLAGNPKYYPSRFYDKEKARENFRSAFYMLRDKNIEAGQELEGIYLNEYYKTCEDVYRSDEEKYYEQFLQDYLEIVQACDNLLIPYYDVPDTIKNDNLNSMYRMFQSYNYYTNHQNEGIKALFKNSGAATKERLTAYYDKKLNEHRRDSSYLNRAINLMNENGCSQTETFYSYCDASYAIKPTYLNCIGCANYSRALKMRQDMINFFLEAKKLATNDLQRGIIAYLIGKETNMECPKDPATQTRYAKNTPEYEEWDANTETSIANLKQVLESYQSALRNSSSIAIRDIPADAAYQLGLAYYRKAVIVFSTKDCDIATSYMDMAAVAYSDESDKNRAKGMKNNIETTRLKVADVEKKIKANAAAHAQWKKENDERIRKQKAVEAFWQN